MLMLLVAFNVVVSNASGEPEEPSTSDDALFSTSDEQPDTASQESPNQLQQPLPLYDPVPGGGVDSYGGPVKPTLSAIDPPEAAPQLLRDEERLAYRTSSGVFVVMLSRPECLSLENHEGFTLVRESYFALKAPTVSTVPVNGQIAHVSPESIVVRYDLMPVGGPAAVGAMEVETDFAREPAPKITARLLWLDPNITDWQVVWLVFPSADARLIVQGLKDFYYPLSMMAGVTVPTSGLSLKLGVPKAGDSSSLSEFTVDWRDAEVGTACVKSAVTISGDYADAVEISFEKGRAEIDPYLVVPDAAQKPTASYQRHTFWYGGYYWVFYPLSTGIGYSLSPDGMTWGWSSTVPGGTALRTDCGFDVAARDGKVVVVWITSDVQYLYSQKGRILGSKIAWDGRVTLATLSLSYGTPPSAAIGSDGSYWVAAQTSNAGTAPNTATVTVYRSLDGVSFGQSWQFTAISGWAKAFDVLLPLGNGNMALVETSGASFAGQISTEIGWRYFSASSSQWSSRSVSNINIQQNEKANRFSAVAGSDGTIYVAYLTNAGAPDVGYPLNLARLKTDGQAGTEEIAPSGTGYPAISLDYNGMLHVFYREGALTIKHRQSSYPADPDGVFYWYSADTIPSLGGTVSYVTCTLAPVQFIAATWFEDLTKIVFCSLPLPYGTPGAGSDPWSREGLSPYGSYFSTAGDYVSPGSGMLTLRMTDVSIPSRGGLDLGISRLYMQPKYFRASDGKPYNEYYDSRNMFSLCKLGQGWGLDLPWMDDTYIGLPGGQRFVIQWGNNGNATEFVNHDGVHFVLSEHHNGTDVYYQLTLASGVSYKFMYSTNEKNLVSISDGRGSDPMNGWTPTGSCINVSYRDQYTRLYYLMDMALNRYIYFAYYTSGTYTGYLMSITSPDGGKTTFNFTTGADGRVLLRNVTDPKNRVTAFEYNTAADYCLASITFPTKAKISYAYMQDTSVGTEVRSWLVTQQVLRDDMGALIRQTDYEYKIVSGRVKFAKVVERNETGQVQGRTEHVYQSETMKYLVETKKNATGTQLSKTVTWFDLNGQPVRVDINKGDSTTVSYSEYTGYDDWGNVIFTRNAMGHESYASYANTNSQNGFFGYGKLTRTSAGKILHDTFDDWDFSDWNAVTIGGTVSMDGSADPPNAPAVMLNRITSKFSLYVQHGFAAQSGDFVVQFSMRTNAAGISASADVYLYAGGTERLWFSAYNGNFEYLTESQCIAIGAYSTDTWYDVGFVIRGNVYDIYIDGVLKYANANLYNSGPIDSIRMYMNGPAVGNLLVDNVRIYKSLTLTVALPTGYSAELFDMKDNAVDRTRNGTLYLPRLAQNGPPFYMKVWKLGADSYDAPFVDMWGGDVYSFAAGVTSSSTNKTTVGFGRAVTSIADDSWPSVTTYSYAPTGALGVEGAWVTDHGYSVSESKYHESAYAHTSHYHGYSAGTAMTVDSDDILAQYVWLEDGKTPQEIMVQYYFGDQWRRAYWGGGGTDEDIIEMASQHSALKPTTVVRVGDVPAVTGKWLQLVVSTADLGLASGTSSVTGIIYGLYGGYARWDFTSRMDRSVQVTGLTSGQEVQLEVTSGSSWRLSKGGSGGYNYWLTAMYNRNYLYAYSSPNSIQLSFSSGPVSYDTGTGTVWRESTVFPVSTISLRMKVDTYSHDGNSGDTMDAGVRMRLYDSSGSNYATYTYWLACWDQDDPNGPNNKTPGANTKVIWGKPPLNTWLNPVLRPSSDWSINWGSCAKIRIELYFYASYALSDYLNVFYDDLTVTDTSGNAESNRFDGEKVILSRKCAAGATSVVLDPYMAGVNACPASGELRVLSAGSMLYESPLTEKMYNMDVYSYSSPKFYPNKVRDCFHDALVGSLTYQDAARSVTQESYVKWDNEGNAIETKSSLGSGWVYSQAGYDKYGNQLWSTDQTGRGTVTEYKITDNSTYPKSVRQGWRTDTFDTDNSWASSSDRTWMTASYSSTRSYSPNRSIKASFSGAQADGQDYGTARSWKEYPYAGNPVQELSVWLYLESWYHNGASSSEIMDTGIKMRLYNSGGTNYATYTYWLACWSGASHNRSAPDQYTKVVYGIGDLPTGTWKNVVLYPSTDWPSVDWANCSKVRFELYVSTSYAHADYLTIYYDNFAHNDFAKNATTRFAYYLWTGAPSRVTDALGRVTAYEYDVLGRLTRVTYPNSAYDTYAYDDKSSKLTKCVYASAGVLASKTVYSFDSIGRLVKAERYGTGTAVYSSESWTYNWQDQVASYTDELNHVTTYAYDCLGRQIRITNPDTSYRTISYNDQSNMVTYTNELGRPVVQIFDDLGRLNSTREHASASLYFETRMTYDAAGNLLTVRDARTQYVQVTRMTYDLLNRLTRTVYPDGFSDSATYDDAGRALTKTDREGNVTTSSYDVAGNLVKLVSPSDTVIYTYDIAGQKTKAQSNLGSLSYVYDSRGRVVQDTEIIGSNTYTLKFGYDAVGNRKWVLYPDNTNVTYDYDAYDRATSVKKATSTTLLTITYNLDDSVATETTGPNTNKKLVTTYTYNNRDWPTKMETKQGSNIKLSLQYTYDTVGNILTLTSTGGGTETFTYDWLNRLSTASAPSAYGSIAYTYDEVGNLLTKVEGSTTTTYTYAMYNLLVSNGTWTFRYDPNLNQNWKNNTANTQKWSYQWNSLDQLTKVVKGTYKSGKWTWTTTGEYSYDANGARAKTVESGTTIEYVFLGHNPMCEKTGTTYTDYVYVNGNVMEKLVGSNIYHYLSDPMIGSTWQVWKDGATSATFSVKCYKPFGTPYTPTGTEKVKYAGEILDTSTCLYYIFARYMDPELGRFISLDPELGRLSQPQSLNRYVYCVNNPLWFTDPTGRHAGGKVAFRGDWPFILPIAGDLIAAGLMVGWEELALYVPIIVKYLQIGWHYREDIWNALVKGTLWTAEGLESIVRTGIGIAVTTIHMGMDLARAFVQTGKAVVGAAVHVGIAITKAAIHMGTTIFREVVKRSIDITTGLVRWGISKGEELLESGYHFVKGTIDWGLSKASELWRALDPSNPYGPWNPVPPIMPPSLFS